MGIKAHIPVCILFCMHWQLYTDIRVDEGEFQSTTGCQRAASFEFGVYLVQRQALRFSPYPSSDL